ncbi:hypothetical protein JCM10908_004108 [Rhodotorula pacifica]|uniref:uncharacterized protein n=1 Tax=Rhodotorula pacifica TaxID=1495444 RepID=UPI00317B738D
MTAADRKIRFVRFRPDDATEVAELRRQRVLCGWGLEKVDLWLKQVQRGVKNLYWIYVDPQPPIAEFEPLNLEPTKYGPPPPDPTFAPIGHVSLDWEDYEGEIELADKERGILTLATFFILGSLQGSGLGNLVMREMEKMAASPELDASVLTLNTLDGNVGRDPAFWARLGVPYKTRINEDWYARLGYTPFRRGVERYPSKAFDGTEFLAEAVFMSKALK